jgi:hypothetical protein
LVTAAGTKFISTPNGEPLFPKLRNALVMGGDLARAMGSLVPLPVRHNFEDNCWDQIAEDFDCLRPLPHIFVEHRHWRRGGAEKDATYERGSADIQDDAAIFEQWLRSNDRLELQRRVGPLFGVTLTTTDPKTIRLAIACPIQNEQVDVAYHKSLNATLAHLGRIGMKVSVIEAAGGSHVGKARERALWETMRRDPTHVLFIDADMGWEPKLITRLIGADHEFCAVAGMKKQDDRKFCVNFLPKQQFHERTDFLEVKDVGFAFVLLKASVIEKMCEAYPELRYNAGENNEYALFLDMIDKDDGEFGERLSEDLSFCRRWRAIGGQIWLDPRSSIVHAGRKEYSGSVSELFVYEKKADAA